MNISDYREVESMINEIQSYKKETQETTKKINSAIHPLSSLKSESSKPEITYLKKEMLDNISTLQKFMERYS